MKHLTIKTLRQIALHLLASIVCVCSACREQEITSQDIDGKSAESQLKADSGFDELIDEGSDYRVYWSDESRAQIEQIEIDNITDEAIQRVRQAPDLKTLYIEVKEPREQVLANLLHSRSLELLSVRGAATDSTTLKKIATLPDLTDLTLVHARIDSQRLPILAAAARLQHLNLSFNDLSGADLLVIARLNELVSFRAVGCRLDDAALKRIAESASIEHLYLAKNNFTDTGILALGTMHSLITLDMRECGVSQQGYDDLHAMLPETIIMWP